MKTSEFLRKIRKPVLDPVKKDLIKNRVMTYVEAKNLSLSKSDSALKDISLARVEKANLKERVFDLISLRKQKSLILHRFFLYQKKFLSFAMLFVFTFYILSVMSIDTRVVRASDFTRLDSFEGSVSVLRNDRVLDIFEGMELKEDDVILTGREAKAVIVFFDDSITRVKNSSELKISDLVSFDGTDVNTYVEVELVSGAVWSKVLNLVEDSSSFVVRSDDVYVKAKKAAFNIEKKHDSLELEVYKNDIELIDLKKSDAVANLKSGQKVSYNSVVDESVVDFVGDEDLEDDWVKENLNEDDEYILSFEENLNEEKKKIIDVEDTEDIVFDDSIAENTLLLITFNDVKKNKIELDLLEKNFIAAQLKLTEEDLSDEEKMDALGFVKKFEDGVSSYYDFLDEIELRDEKYAYELRLELKQKLKSYKKDLSIVLPDSPLYDVKESMTKLVKIDEDTNDAFVVLKEVDEVKDKLYEAEDLAIKGNLDLAEEHVIKSQDQIKDVYEKIEGMDKTEEIEDTSEDDFVEDLDFVGLDYEEEIVDEDVFEDQEDFESDIVDTDLEESIVKLEALDDDEILDENDLAVDQLPVSAELEVEEEDGALLDDEISDLKKKVEEVEGLQTDLINKIEQGEYGLNVYGDKVLPPLLN